MNRALLLVPLLLAASASAATAQDAKRKPASWAPEWKVGDWWVVKTFQRDLSDRLTSPGPLKGKAGVPRLPEDPRTADLPGFPALRHGIPRGFKAGNRWRFTVLRKEVVKYDDDPPLDTKPETFWVVKVTSLEGQPVRRAELWYAVEDLVLSKVVVKAKGGAKDQVVWFNGSVQMALPVGTQLGLPLDWPDLHAARRAKARFRITDRPSVEQRVRQGKVGMPEDEIWVRVQEIISTKKARAKPRATLFVFKRGEPFWSRIHTGMVIAELEKHGSAGR